MIGNIFSVEEFAVFDGPGIRTSVFLKGCPLRCSWCHNPEGQRRESEIVKSPNGCIGCGNCIKRAKVLDGRTILTEDSIKKCPMNLIRVCGDKMTSKELLGRLLKNERILKNGGGIKKVSMLVKNFIMLGGHQLQINSINREQLLEAQKHPEDYPNLIVRVWGWSGYFNELDMEYQNHIIRRCEYTN